MKTKEELNELKQKFDTLNKEIQELNDDELDAVSGGHIIVIARDGVSSNKAKYLNEGLLKQANRLNSLGGTATPLLAGQIDIIGGADGPTAIYLVKNGDKQ
ncbi:MAG: hypothetical protein KBT35_07665 [Firmicutes bacterium]|nr:hypothetical protein [Candidatus Colivicinus equi]